jgi:hypothetical protein
MNTPNSKQKRQDFLDLQKQLSAQENGNTRVAEYESLLDLFTLISLILICAVYLYVSNSNGGTASETQVNSSFAGSGSELPTTIPTDVVLLILHKSDQTDYLTIMDGSDSSKKVEPITKENLDLVLSSLVEKIKRAGKVEFAVNDENEDANRFIWTEIDKWFAKNHRQYKFYFCGKD